MFDNKPFNQKTYDENDIECRAILIESYNKRGFFTLDGNKVDRYGCDIMIGFYCDVERRPSWRGAKFPFNTIHVPYRKKKMIDGKRFKYYVFNRDRDYILVCDGQDILDSNIVAIKTKEGTLNERFFDVDIKNFKLYKI